MVSTARTIRICNDLVSLIETIQKKYEEKNGFSISSSKASKILFERIEKAGGLRNEI